ncbi:MAG: HNH endonuclease [Acidobacteriaceae bacterium]|nr:HNH endonuclease [Acidobacteriaceae bacterium]
MNTHLLRQVAFQAADRCEYCHLPASASPPPFQIDHIIARQHGGKTEPDNLALCCVHCNRYKGPNIAGIDQVSGEIVRLFHPRKDIWAEHFRWSGAELIGITAVGRVTIQVLFINDPEMQSFRLALMEETGSGLV